MARNIDHVVDTAHDPVVAILVTAGAVTRKVAIRIAINCAKHARPWFLDNEKAARTLWDWLAIHRHDFRYDTRNWASRRSRLSGNRARDRRDHDVTGLGLPPRVDNGTAVMANHFAEPHPGFGIDRLANRAKQAQAVQLVFSGPLVAPLDESPNGSRCCVENVDLVPVNDVPETVGLGKIRSAFIHHACGPVLQRPVNNVAVTRNPTDVSRTPERVLVTQIKNPLRREVGSN